MDICFIVLVICGAVLAIVSFFVGYYVFKNVNANTSAKIIVIASPIALVLIALSMYGYFNRPEINWLGFFVSLITLGFTIYVYVTSIIALKKSKEEK